MTTPDNVAAPTYSLTINGVELSGNVEDTSWTTNQQWSRQGDTATFYLVDENPTGALSFVVTPLAKIVLTDLSLGEVLFSGFVTLPEMTWLAPNLQRWQLTCVDATYISDRTIAFGDFVNQGAGQIIKSVVTTSSCGLTTNNVNPGPMIPRIQLNYLSLSEALKKICKYCGVTSTFGWYVDETYDLHFYDEAAAGAVKALLSDDPHDFVTGSYVPGFNGNYVQGAKYQWDATSIRNAITVRGGNYVGSRLDEWLGNGTQFAWPLTFAPDTASASTAVMSLSVAGVTKTVSIQTGSSATTQWALVQAANNGIWTLTNLTDSVPASGALVKLTYNYLAPVISKVQDAASIATFNTLPNKGVFGMYIADPNLLNVGSAQIRGRRELHNYSVPEERIVLKTAEVYTGHFRAGQIVQIKNGLIADSKNGYLPGINDQFLVVQCLMAGSFSGYRTYSITAVRISTGGGP